MERREFLQTVLRAPLFAPLLSALPIDPDRGEISLISDQPQVDIPPLLRRLQSNVGHELRTFSFLNPDLCPNGMDLVLAKHGWRQVPPSFRADAAFSFHRLEQKTFPSLTLVTAGRIRDIRSWMSASGRYPKKAGLSASLLTIVSYPGSQAPKAAGKAVSLYKNGEKILQLPLGEDSIQKIPTNKGPLIVRVAGRRAWIEESPCRNKICVSTPPVFLAGERVICAPHHFLLEIQGPTVDTVIG
jgi:hypothetical protein